MRFCDSTIYTGLHSVTHEIFVARDFVSFWFAHPALPIMRICIYLKAYRLRMIITTNNDKNG
jgi:hypothetical protein